MSYDTLHFDTRTQTNRVFVWALKCALGGERICRKLGNFSPVIKA